LKDIGGRRNVASKMEVASMAKEQLSVKLDAEQLTFLEREARREHRTISALVRHLVAVAAQQARERAASA
jgi:hypothetical protein